MVIAFFVGESETARRNHPKAATKNRNQKTFGRINLKKNLLAIENCFARSAVCLLVHVENGSLDDFFYKVHVYVKWQRPE